jgi:hypothetical protein
MEDQPDVSFLFLKVCKPLYIFTSKNPSKYLRKNTLFWFKTLDQPGTNKKTPTMWVCKCLIFLKIRPSLTTSKGGLTTNNIHLVTTFF